MPYKNILNDKYVKSDTNEIVDVCQKSRKFIGEM